VSPAASRPGFWQRSDVRRRLPLAAAAAGLVLLLLTLAVLPPRRAALPPPAPAEAAPEAAAISQERVDLRREPSERSTAVRALVRGEEVTIVDLRGIWARVRDRDGQEGFLPLESLEADAARTNRARRAETIFKFAPLSGDVAERTAVRLGPFSFAPKWGEAEPGAAVEIYSVDHDYYAIRLSDGTLGFIASRDVDLVPANPSEPALAETAGRVVREITVTEEGAPDTAGGVAGSEPGAPAEPGERAPSVPSSAIAPAVLLTRVDPAYPSAALAAGVAGTVVLDLHIDETGAVTDVDVRREGPLGMTEAAVAAVRQWRYRPAMGPAGPIAAIKRVRIDFQPSH
jgi:TonB family protein